MQSFLITSKDKNKASSYISDFLKEKEIYPIDVDMQAYEKAMGIEDVRNIQKKILLKPFKGKIKAVVIQAYENITTEAQNALLKVLEEPPANTIIAVSVPKKEFLLPTITSRCKIIELNGDKQTLSNDEITQLHNYLISLFQSGLGYKLKLAQDIAKDKEGATLWLEKMAVFVKDKLTQDNSNLKYLNFLKELQKTYKAIKSTNVSLRTALENLFLSL